MSNDRAHECIWRVTGESVRGASHERSGRTNQDAIQWWQDDLEGSRAVLCVSDGHGSPKSFRSHLGSRFAVSETMTLLRTLAEEPEAADMTYVARVLKESMPTWIVRNWNTAVDRHLEENTFTMEERSALDRAELTKVEKSPRLAYGATLVAVLATDSYVVYLQLGDGDLLRVSKSGETQRIFQRDPAKGPDETDSLCLNDAWALVRSRVVPHLLDPPVLILASTDGYSNCFENDQAFLRIGEDYLRLIRTDGLERTRLRLSEFLTSASREASGDDISLGLVRRIEPGDPDSFERRLAETESLARDAASRAYVTDAVSNLAKTLRDETEPKLDLIEERFIDQVEAILKTQAELERNQDELRVAADRNEAVLQDIVGGFRNEFREAGKNQGLLFDRVSAIERVERKPWRRWAPQIQFALLLAAVVILWIGLA